VRVRNSRCSVAITTVPANSACLRTAGKASRTLKRVRVGASPWRLGAMTEKQRRSNFRAGLGAPSSGPGRGADVAQHGSTGPARGRGAKEASPRGPLRFRVVAPAGCRRWHRLAPSEVAKTADQLWARGGPAAPHAIWVAARLGWSPARSPCHRADTGDERNQPASVVRL